MTNNDRAAFAALLADVFGFYREPLSDFAVSVWWESCKTFELRAVRLAMTGHATDPERGQFIPKPADVIRQLRGTTKDEALTAWQRVIGQVGHVGRYGTPRLSEAESVALGAIGGWQRLCNSQEDELGHLAREFCANFQAIEATERRQDLIGAPSEVVRLAGDLIGRITNEVRNGK